MSEFKESIYKDISFIQAALEGYIGLLNVDVESSELNDDERLTMA